MRFPSIPIALAVLLVLGAAPAALGQTHTSNEEAAVRAALQHYLDGHATGLGSEHAKVFHPEARLFWVRDGALATVTSEEYIARASGEPAPDEDRRRRRIAMVDIAGDAAVARVELDYPDALIVDYMSLLKLDGEWRIVNKIFHVEDRSGGR